MSQKRQNQPSISGFFTKIPKISYNEPSKVDEKNEEKNEPNTEENYKDFSQNETKD